MFLVAGQWSPQAQVQEGELDVECFTQSRAVFSNTSQCRRRIFGETFDGSPRSCAQLEALECDTCNPNSALVQQIRAWQAVPPPQSSLSSTSTTSLILSTLVPHVPPPPQPASVPLSGAPVPPLPARSMAIAGPSHSATIPPLPLRISWQDPHARSVASMAVAMEAAHA